MKVRGGLSGAKPLIMFKYGNLKNCFGRFAPLLNLRLEHYTER